jgi:CRP/FNR family transcriptional regulator, nitrogen fixation regulation protein
MHVLAQTQQVVSHAASGIAEPDALSLLEQFGSTVRAERDSEIHAEGDAAAYCYRVVSGCVRTVQLLEDGRRQVCEFFLHGDLFGFDWGETHDFSVEAVNDVVLRRYPRRMVDGLAESRPALSLRLRDLTRRHLRAAQDRIVALGRRTACERVAAFVLEMRRRLPGNQALLDLPMCRTDVADHLGLTVETVCRVLAQMKRDGTVGITRTGVEIRNLRGMAELACGTRH